MLPPDSELELVTLKLQHEMETGHKMIGVRLSIVAQVGFAPISSTLAKLMEKTKGTRRACLSARPSSPKPWQLYLCSSLLAEWFHSLRSVVFTMKMRTATARYQLWIEKYCNWSKAQSPRRYRSIPCNSAVSRNLQGTVFEEWCGCRYLKLTYQ